MFPNGRLSTGRREKPSNPPEHSSFGSEDPRFLCCSAPKDMPTNLPAELCLAAITEVIRVGGWGRELISRSRPPPPHTHTHTYPHPVPSLLFFVPSSRETVPPMQLFFIPNTGYRGFGKWGWAWGGIYHFPSQLIAAARGVLNSLIFRHRRLVTTDSVFTSNQTGKVYGFERSPGRSSGGDVFPPSPGQ